MMNALTANDDQTDCVWIVGGRKNTSVISGILDDGAFYRQTAQYVALHLPRDLHSTNTIWRNTSVYNKGQLVLFVQVHG